jgi:hypothetical protein
MDSSRGLNHRDALQSVVYLLDDTQAGRQEFMQHDHISVVDCKLTVQLYGLLGSGQRILSPPLVP